MGLVTMNSPTTASDGSDGDAMGITTRTANGSTMRTVLVAAALTVLLAGGAFLALKPGREAVPVKTRPESVQPVVHTDPFSSAIKRQIRELKRRIEELGTQWTLNKEQATRRIADNSKALHALQEMVATLPTAEGVARLQASIKANHDEMSQGIAKIQRSLKPLQVQAKARNARKPRPVLPFELVSVDLWDGVPYAALANENKIDLLRQGQSRAGWTVEHIDYGSGKVRFRDAGGHSVERSMAR